VFCVRIIDPDKRSPSLQKLGILSLGNEEQKNLLRLPFWIIICEACPVAGLHNRELSLVGKRGIEMGSGSRR